MPEAVLPDLKLADEIVEMLAAGRAVADVAERIAQHRLSFGMSQLQRIRELERRLEDGSGCDA